MSSRPPSKLVSLLMLSIVAVPFLLRLSLLRTRGFNPDELEHLHWSWCVAKGLLPNRDYFDHHTPWLHVFLAQFLPFFDVERVPDEAFAFILLARRWMWVFSGAILAATFLLGRTLLDARASLLSTLLLANTGFFLAKSLEVRPDVPAAALLLAAIHLAIVGCRRETGGRGGASLALVASGLALGSATMFTQKILFVGPGIALAALWFLLDGRLRVSLRARLRLLVLQGLGFLLPLGVTLGYFASKGALREFIEANFLLNTRWPGLGAWGFLVELVRQDPIYVVLGCAGLLILGVRIFRRENAIRCEPAVALPLLSLIATLPLHPAMSYQHFLLILPLFSLYAGWALASLVDRLSRGAEERSAAVLAIAVVLLSIVPLSRFRAAFDRGNWGTLQGIAYVLRNSSPFETTLDGFTGLGLFRPQAFFHHFHYPHAFALQSGEEHREMTRALESGGALPKMVFWTHYLREGVSPETASFLEKNYVPSGLEPIRIRPFDNGIGFWSDEGPRYFGWDPAADPRAPHVFFDDGWRPPTTEFGAFVRRTRTRRSGLIVPIKYPRDFAAVFRAHADPESGPFGVELVVNGASAGVVEAVPRWQDYEFPVTVHQLRPGFNELELRFSAEEDREERRLELAVNYLELRERERLVATSAEAPGKAGAVDEEPRKSSEDGKGVTVGEKVEAEERAAREMEVQHHEKGEEGDEPGAEAEQETDTGGELGERNDPREDRGGGDRDRLEVEAAERGRLEWPFRERLGEEIAVREPGDLGDALEEKEHAQSDAHHHEAHLDSSPTKRSR
jgi:hypothetical protein